jgi:hypothetical protein
MSIAHLMPSAPRNITGQQDNGPMTPRDELELYKALVEDMPE